LKEAFKLGGYAWHAHKRFEALKGGWSFNKTVEWLNSVGIRFTKPAIKAFTNVYVTYAGTKFPVVTDSLVGVYNFVNQLAQELVDLPEKKINVIRSIFQALPSDDSTNPKELIRELIRAGKVDIEEFTPELATKFRKEAEEAANKIKEEAEAERKRIEEEKSRLNDTIKALSRQIAEIKKEAKDEVSLEFHGKLKGLEDEKVKLEKEVKRLEDGYEDMEDEAMRSAKLAEQKEKQLEEIQKKYEEILKEKAEIEKDNKKNRELKERFEKLEETNRTIRQKLKELESGEALQKKIIAGLNSLDVGITHLDVLRGEASNMSPTISKYLDDNCREERTESVIFRTPSSKQG